MLYFETEKIMYQMEKFSRVLDEAGPEKVGDIQWKYNVCSHRFRNGSHNRLNKQSSSSWAYPMPGHDDGANADGGNAWWWH